MKELRYTARAFGQYKARSKVAIVGSALVQPDSPTYGMAKAMGRKLARNGCVVITGGDGHHAGGECGLILSTCACKDTSAACRDIIRACCRWALPRTCCEREGPAPVTSYDRDSRSPFN
jgi:hypothetical protein